jgi:hypothetical protein
MSNSNERQNGGTAERQNGGRNQRLPAADRDQWING